MNTFRETLNFVMVMGLVAFVIGFCLCVILVLLPKAGAGDLKRFLERSIIFSAITGVILILYVFLAPVIQNIFR